MEQDINQLLSNLESELIEFKENESKKLVEQEKRLENLETKYKTVSNLPFVSSSEKIESSHNRMLCEYLKKGITHSNEIKSSGFPLQNTFMNMMHTYMKSISPIRRLASVQQISTDSITYVHSKKGIEASWVENDDVVKQEASDDLCTTYITTYELYTQPKVTQKVLDDVSLDVEKWLVERAALAFTQLENYTFINGDGDGKPHGILAYNECPVQVKICDVETKGNTQITEDDILKLYYSLPTEFTPNGTFLMHSSVIQMIRGLHYKNTNTPMFQPGNGITPDLLMGLPVVECSEMPIISTTASSSPPCYPILFGDFKRGYQIVDRSDMRVLRDPYSTKPYISFYMTKRIGAEVLNPTAFVLLKLKSS